MRAWAKRAHWAPGDAYPCGKDSSGVSSCVLEGEATLEGSAKRSWTFVWDHFQ